MENNPYDEYTGECLKCGETIRHVKRFGAQFCSDKCRSDYHNHKRKTDRKLNRIVTLIRELSKELAPDGQVAIYTALQNIESTVNSYKPKMVWFCGTCGQSVFVEPNRQHKCDYCGESNWKPASSYRDYQSLAKHIHDKYLETQEVS